MVFEVDCKPLILFSSEKVASQSESVDHFRTLMEAQLESNREFHARQVKRLRDQIEAKNTQEESLQAHAESDRIKSEYAQLQMETKHDRTNEADNDLRGLDEPGKRSSVVFNQ